MRSLAERLRDLNEHGGAWQRAVAMVWSGERPKWRFVRLGRTPNSLRRLGLGPADLVMSVAKMVRAMRDHPSVPLAVWAQLPSLLVNAVAGFPSQHDDGAVIVVLVERDDADDPIVVPILWDADQRLNVVLSVYGRSTNDRLTGDEWVHAQVKRAQKDGRAHFEKMDLADTEPKPEPASLDATPLSPGSIPEDRPARPRKEILSLPRRSS